MHMKCRSIAIDGPSGAGKSTLAKRLAAELGFRYVDTGAIYRTVALAACRNGIDCADGRTMAEMLPRLEITLNYGKDGLQRMYLDGEDVTELIRQEEISVCTSRVAAIAAVREFLLNTQRRLAQQHDVIMDGRDIGTVVLPQADLKIYLTASPEARAHRRYLELMERGQQVDPNHVLRDVVERDRRDMEREIAPLRQAEDAVVVDTTGLDLEESFQLLLEQIKTRLEEKKRD